MKSIPLRRLIILPFVVLALLSGAIMYFVATVSFANIANKVGLQYIHEVENRVQERLQHFMGPLQHIVEINQQAYSVRPKDLDDLQRAAIRFHEQALPYPQMTFISLATADGRYLSSVQPPFKEDHSHHLAANFVHQPLTMEGFEYDPQQGLGEKRQQDAVFGYDPRTRPYYQDALGKSTPVWGDVERYYGYDSLGVTLSAAIYNDQQEVLGVTATSVALSEFDNYLKSLDMVDQGYLFLAEQNGNLIASSADHSLFSFDEGVTQRVSLADHPNALFRMASKHLQARAYQLSLQGEDYIYYVHPIAFDYGQTWLLGVLIPSTYHKNVLSDYTYITIMITLILFICIALVGSLLAWYIGKPIRLLNKVAHDNNVKSIKHLPDSISGVREINSLNQGLKDMAYALDDVLQNLEQKVAERTSYLKDENETLLESSVKDELTNLYNRRGLKQEFHFMSEKAQRQSQSLMLVLCDIDHFKEFNDKYGHGVGDQVLVQVAENLSSHIRSGIDIVARYGGEEFVLVFVNTNLEKVLNRLNMIRQALASTSVGDNEHITMSFGISSMGVGDTTAVEQLIDQADSRLYEAKNSGRDKIVY
ncbi:diguanylate cyclase [Marinomonas sp.]